MWGLLASDGGFDVMAGGSAIGRRHLDKAAVDALTGFADRYARLLDATQPAAGLLALGHDLYRWLDGDGRQLTELLKQAQPPFCGVQPGSSSILASKTTPKRPST